jgi:hemerythrin-like metal-binding protein
MSGQAKSHLKLGSRYILGFKIIDDQHAYFVGLLNELYDAINQIENNEKLGHILDELINYAGFHFATEEKYFDEFKYIEKNEHVRQHREITTKLGVLKDGFVGNEMIVAGELADLMEDWLVDHIAIYDKKYVDCFRSHGLT